MNMFDVSVIVEDLESALRAGHTGAAGRLDLADATSVTDWAVFYLRYSEFLQEPKEVWRGVPGIPADNAAYDGEAIRRFVMNSDDGFWEVEFHRQLHAAGGSLAVVPGATARYARSFPFPTIARHRFHHGRHAGAWRASRAGRSAAMIVAGTPLVPFALALRAWRRVRPMVEHRGRFVHACLGSLLGQCQRLNAELLVARAGSAPDVAALAKTYPGVRFVTAPADASIPQLRAVGMAQASGDVVALTEDHCVADANWVEA